MESGKRFTRLKFGVAFLLTIFLSACDEDEPVVLEAVSPAEFIILNNLNDKPNVSGYDYNGKILTESVYSFESQYRSYLTNAAKKDNHLLIATTGAEYKFVKVNVNTGKEERVVDSWMSAFPHVEFHSNNIIACELPGLQKRTLITKIYN